MYNRSCLIKYQDQLCNGRNKGEPMINKMKCIVYALVMLLASGLSYGFDDTKTGAGKCFLWEVRSKTATVYLMGSFHMFKKNMYPLDNCFNNAFKKSDTLVVEVNMNAVDQEKITTLFNDRGIYKGDEILERQLTRETLDKLNDYLDRVGADISQVNMMRPWFLGMNIAVQEMIGLGYDPTLGVDSYFLANAAGKNILELETIEEQLDILAGDPDDVQDMALRAALDDIPNLEPLMNKMVHAWETGDAEELDEIMREPSDQYPMLEQQFKRTIDDRNVMMARKIADYLKTDKTYFVVVGGGHMGGKKGLVALLKGMGYTLNQIQKVGEPIQSGQNESFSKLEESIALVK